MNKLFVTGFVALSLIMFLSCSKDKKTNPAPQVPTITSSTVTNITQTTAQCGGTVTSDGGANVFYRGVCWSTNPLPTYSDMKTYDGPGTGAFTSSISGLTAMTHYYVRAYAINDAGPGYGEIDTFTTLSPASVPVLITSQVTDITQTTAQCGGTVVSDEGANVIYRGVCWSTNPIPTYSDSKTYDSTDTDTFTNSITGLTVGANYYIRAYAMNAAGIGYGNLVSFATHDSTGMVTDIDGNIYATVKIGTQWWMAENLKVTHYQNGNSIPNVPNGNSWNTLTTGAYCNYNNDTNQVAVYGRLYNWYAARDSRNIAPAGWHVASDHDWQVLVEYLGGDTIASGKLKEAGTAHWFAPNFGATNETGFAALPAGFRNPNGDYVNIRGVACYWSAVSDTLGRAMDYSCSWVFRYQYYARTGESVRCIKN